MTEQSVTLEDISLDEIDVPLYDDDRSLSQHNDDRVDAARDIPTATLGDAYEAGRDDDDDDDDKIRRRDADLGSSSSSSSKQCASPMKKEEETETMRSHRRLHETIRPIRFERPTRSERPTSRNVYSPRKIQKTYHRGSDLIHRGSDSIHRGSDSIHRGSDSIHRGSDPIHRGSDSIHRGSDSIHRGSDTECTTRSKGLDCLCVTENIRHKCTFFIQDNHRSRVQMLPYMAAALQMVAATITGDEVANIIDIPRGGRFSGDQIPDTSQLRKWIISLGAVPEVVFDRESDKTILCARMQKSTPAQQHHTT